MLIHNIGKSKGASNLSTQLWNVKWQEHFPATVGDGITVKISSFEDVNAFAAKHFPEIYDFKPENQRFVDSSDSSTKLRYYAAIGDFFAFYDNEVIVGIALGTPLDWSGYNFRNVSLLASHQGRGIYQDFFPLLSNILKSHGVERVEGDVAPSNLPHIFALTKMGAVVTGLNLSDRWGACLHFTKYLQKNAQQVFNHQFCLSTHDLKEREGGQVRQQRKEEDAA